MVDGATDGSMLPEAEAAYKGVRGNPAHVGPVAAVLAERARAAGQTEAHVVALHAYAWAEHEALRNEVARELLGRALRVAARAGLWPSSAGDLLVSRAAVNQELGRLPAAHRDLERAGALLPVDRLPRLRAPAGGHRAQRGPAAPGGHAVPVPPGGRGVRRRGPGEGGQQPGRARAARVGAPKPPCRGRTSPSSSRLPSDP